MRCLGRRGELFSIFPSGPAMSFGSRFHDGVGKHPFYSWLVLDPGEPSPSFRWGVRLSRLTVWCTASLSSGGGNQEANLEANDQGSCNYPGKKNSLIVRLCQMSIHYRGLLISTHTNVTGLIVLKNGLSRPHCKIRKGHDV